MTVCSTACGYCGRCDSERRPVVLCDGCGENQVDPDDFGPEDERLCWRCGDDVEAVGEFTPAEHFDHEEAAREDYGREDW
jgi:hypothetical protein